MSGFSSSTWWPGDSPMSLNSSVVCSHGWVVFHCTNIPKGAYKFSYWWTFGSFPVWGCFKEVITNIFHKSFCSYEHSFVLAIYPQVEFPGPMELILLETGSCPKWLYHCTFPAAMNEGRLKIPHTAVNLLLILNNKVWKHHGTGSRIPSFLP